jgi:hypothetical protein
MGIAQIAPNDLLASVYDGPFDEVTAAIFRAMVLASTSGVIAQRLDDLEAEAARLAEEGRSLTPDNPMVRALIADLEPVMAANAVLVQSAAGDMVLTGTMAASILARQLALPGLTDDALAVLGVPWIGIDPVAMAAAIGYVQSEAWQDMIATFQADVLEKVNTAVLTGIAQGRSAAAIVSDIRGLVASVPVSQARQMLRTLQLVSSRDAQQAHRIANAEILEFQIRIAALDARTCMACVALHGTVLPIDARVDDHHNGRCTSVTKVVGFPVPEVTPGSAWFNALTEEQQIAQMGQSAWTAWQAGRVGLDDFILPYTDDVFGDMIGTKSLAGILGDEAQRFK